MLRCHVSFREGTSQYICEHPLERLHFRLNEKNVFSRLGYFEVGDVKVSV